MIDAYARIKDHKIVAVLRADDREQAYQAALAAFRGGIPALEITFTTPGAEGLIAKLTGELSGALVGAGSIVTESDAEAAVRSGASFFVSPHSDPKLIAWFRSRGLAYVPGCLTPSELMAAKSAGCQLQKLFPASLHGPSGVKSLLAPLPGLQLIVTGGVSEETVQPFLRAGAVAVCVGANVFSKDRMAAKDWSGIEQSCARLAQLCRAP